MACPHNTRPERTLHTADKKEVQIIAGVCGEACDTCAFIQQSWQQVLVSSKTGQAAVLFVNAEVFRSCTSKSHDLPEVLSWIIGRDCVSVFSSTQCEPVNPHN